MRTSGRISQMEPRRSGGQLLTDLSNALVALHRQHFGRGPGAAKSYIVDDMVVCVLTDIYTRVERTLIEAGKHDHVRHTRQLHQQALADALRKAVKETTGREVLAFVSSVHFDPDVAFEIFLLESSD
jgi:uncharacterized protein YbcI